MEVLTIFQLNGSALLHTSHTMARYLYSSSSYVSNVEYLSYIYTSDGEGEDVTGTQGMKRVNAGYFDFDTDSDSGEENSPVYFGLPSSREPTMLGPKRRY